MISEQSKYFASHVLNQEVEHKPEPKPHIKKVSKSKVIHEIIEQLHIVEEQYKLIKANKLMRSEDLKRLEHKIGFLKQLVEKRG